MVLFDGLPEPRSSSPDSAIWKQALNLPDGTGYSDQLKGEEIPLLARILSVVDVYDALTTERPYKPALPSDRAVRELREEAAKGWKFQAIVEEFATLATQGAFAQIALPATVRAPHLERWRTSI